MTDSVVLDGGLTCEQVHTIAHGDVPVVVGPAAMARATAAHEVAEEVVLRRPVYGRTTGVGSNRTVQVGTAEAADHGLRLLRSHAGGAGPLVAPAVARAMMLVRLNQLAVGGSGVHPSVLHALAAAVNRGRVPRVHQVGAIGTADLTALASAALSLLGERPWADGSVGHLPVSHLPPHRLDALAFVSSNAATIGEAALACFEKTELLDATLVVAGLSFLALDGSAEAFVPAVHDARPHPGQRDTALRLRTLVGGEAGFTPGRVQDPFGLRALPQVHGPAVEAALHLAEVLRIEMNSASENPLIDVASRDVLHNGNFHTAYLTYALDTARATLFSTAGLSTARLGALVEPTFTALRPFLADGPAGSSGVMILEYVAHSALADLRHTAAPAGLGNAVLSRGAEEHASFSAQSAHRTSEVLPSYRTVLACELVAAVRALRQRSVAPRGEGLSAAFSAAAAVLDDSAADRPLVLDIEAASELLPSLAVHVRGSALS
jgi:histidine ammonia-lyase